MKTQADKKNTKKKPKKLYPARSAWAFVLGFLCLAYYFVVLLRGGAHTSIIWIWLAGFAFFSLVGAVLLLLGRIPIGNPLCLFAVIIVLSLFGSFFIFEGVMIKTALDSPPEGVECIVVLGAAVKGERPSTALTRRIEAAYGYLERNPDTVAVLSGGMGYGENITEAECMRRELTAMGISEDRLILEDRSRDTAENIQNTLGIIGDRYKSIALVTNNFHVYRAMRLAKTATDIPVYGISAPFDSPLVVHFAVREYIGTCRDTVRGLIK